MQVANFFVFFGIKKANKTENKVKQETNFFCVFDIEKANKAENKVKQDNNKVKRLDVAIRPGTG
jgi:hypothetical protein